MNSYKWALSTVLLGALMLSACQPVMPEEPEVPPALPELPGEILIPAGTFQMGCEPADRCPENQLPLHIVYLDAYYIDKFEVTNERYQACVDDGGCLPLRISDSMTRDSYYGVPEYSNYPVVNVDWFEALTFCEWEGKRLPTEAEWMKAARGADDTRTYPWGDETPTCEHANYWEGMDGCVGDTSEVGSYPLGASPYGVMNMGGNVAEWVSDWYADDYYTVSPTDNPSGPAIGSERMLLGGYFGSTDGNTKVAFRDRSSPNINWYDLGIRCAHSP